MREVSLSLLNEIYSRYSVKEIPKSRGRKRIIHVPDDCLKQRQREWFRNEVRNGVGPGPYAHAFTKRRGVRTHVMKHAGKEYVFEADLKDFFHHVTPEHLARTWMDYDGFYRHEVEMRFRPIRPDLGSFLAPPAGLVYLAFIPSSVVGGDMFGCCLPQGSPLSPYLSNIAFKPIDFSINAYLGKMLGKGNYEYSRYADNLVVSSDSPSIKALRDIFPRILEMRGFPVNKQKFRYMTLKQRQQVCGIVVNKFPNFQQRLARRCRGMIGNLVKTVTRQRERSRDGIVPVRDWSLVVKDFRHVDGVMSYARDVAPLFFEKYRERLSVIRTCLKAMGHI